MSILQIGLIAIVSFISVVSGLFFTVRIVHPTREEMNKYVDCKTNVLQTKDSCKLFHQTQDVRNMSFTNALVEIKDEIKELRKDIKEVIAFFMKDKA